MRRRVGTLHRQIADRLDRLFIPRELFLRSNGRVRYLRISRRQQMMAAALTAAVAGWTLASTGGLAVGAFALQDRQARLDAAAAATEVLRRDLDMSQARLAELDEILDRRQATVADLALLTSEKQALARELETARGELAALEQERERATVAWRRSEAELAAKSARNAALSDEIAGLRAGIDELRLAGDDGDKARRALDRRVVELSRRLDDATAENRRLTRTIAGMQRAAALVAYDRSALREARDELSSKVAFLENRISSLQATQQSIVQRLAERTRTTVAEIERALEMTGLDVDELLEAASGKLSGAGGPFVPAVGRLRGADELKLLASIRKLDGEVDRWGRLQLVLRNLPLAPPLDSYSLLSGFGERKDPINGKPAVHAGVDLKNQLGTPVLATAPGTVIYAGWKGDYGRFVEIDHGLGIRTRYAHLKSISVKAGQAVEFRQEIGKLGTSGRSTGPHLHYEVQVNGKPHDPMNFMEAGKYVFKG